MVSDWIIIQSDMFEQLQADTKYVQPVAPWIAMTSGRRSVLLSQGSPSSLRPDRIAASTNCPSERGQLLLATRMISLMLEEHTPQGAADDLESHYPIPGSPAVCVWYSSSPS